MVSQQKDTVTALRPLYNINYTYMIAIHKSSTMSVSWSFVYCTDNLSMRTQLLDHHLYQFVAEETTFRSFLNIFPFFLMFTP